MEPKRTSPGADKHSCFYSAQKKYTGDHSMTNLPGKVYTGNVRYFSEAAGQGFIYDNLTRQNHFVYAISLEEKIKTNDLVSFELTKTPGGIKVTHVKKTKTISL